MRAIDADELKKHAFRVSDCIFEDERNELVVSVNAIDNAPTVPQINVFCENADEKAIEDMKAELQSVIDARPEGEWIRKEDVIAILNKWADGYCYIEIPTEDAIKAIVDFNPIRR